MTDCVRNEAGVREEIIAPILAALGYSACGRNSISYELPLSYPRESLGRRKVTDPLIRGKADYVCYAGGRVAWTIEAKSEGESITPEVVAQAYSYAKHSEVRAEYFCVCNGIEFRIYATLAAPDQPPLLTVDPRNRELAVAALREFVGSGPLQSRFAQVAASAFPPLGPGLSSFAQVIRGTIVHEKQNPEIPALKGFTVYVENGIIERVDGGLSGRFEGRAPISALQDVINKLGLTSLELRSESTDLSSDAGNPTLFVTETAAVFPQGEVMPIIGGGEYVLPFDLHCQLSVRARIALIGNILTGPFEVDMRYARPHDLATVLFSITSSGTAQLILR